MLLPTCPDLKAIRELIVSPYLRSQVQVLFSLNFMLWNSFPFHNLKNNHSSGWHRWNCYDKFEHNFLWFWCLRTSDLSVMKTSNITKKYDLDLFGISETRGLHNFHKILSDNKQVNDFNLSFLGKFSSLAENAFFFCIITIFGWFLLEFLDPRVCHVRTTMLVHALLKIWIVLQDDLKSAQ